MSLRANVMSEATPVLAAAQLSACASVSTKLGIALSPRAAPRKDIKKLPDQIGEFSSMKELLLFVFFLLTALHSQFRLGFRWCNFCPRNSFHLFLNFGERGHRNHGFGVGKNANLIRNRHVLHTDTVAGMGKGRNIHLKLYG